MPTSTTVPGNQSKSSLPLASSSSLAGRPSSAPTRAPVHQSALNTAGGSAAPSDPMIVLVDINVPSANNNSSSTAKQSMPSGIEKAHARPPSGGSSRIPAQHTTVQHVSIKPVEFAATNRSPIVQLHQPQVNLALSSSSTGVGGLRPRPASSPGPGDPRRVHMMSSLSGSSTAAATNSQTQQKAFSASDTLLLHRSWSSASVRAAPSLAVNGSTNSGTRTASLSSPAAVSGLDNKTRTMRSSTRVALPGPTAATTHSNTPPSIAGGVGGPTKSASANSKGLRLVGGPQLTSFLSTMNGGLSIDGKAYSLGKSK